MATPVTMFEVIARDTNLLGSFYTRLFGWRREVMPGMDYALLHTEAGSGAGGAVGGSDSGLPPGLAVYVEVDDVDSALARAKELGASRVLMEPYDLPGIGRFAMFTDPEGNRVGLAKMGA